MEASGGADVPARPTRTARHHGRFGARLPRRNGSERSERIPLTVWVAVLILTLGILLIPFGSSLAPQSATSQHLTLGLSTPSGDHWLGTDTLGRDIFSRAMAGARPALLGGAAGRWATRTAS